MINGRCVAAKAAFVDVRVDGVDVVLLHGSVNINTVMCYVVEVVTDEQQSHHLCDGLALCCWCCC